MAGPTGKDVVRKLRALRGATVYPTVPQRRVRIQDIRAARDPVPLDRQTVNRTARPHRQLLLRSQRPHIRAATEPRNVQVPSEPELPRRPLRCSQLRLRCRLSDSVTGPRPVAGNHRLALTPRQIRGVRRDQVRPRPEIVRPVRVVRRPKNVVVLVHPHRATEVVRHLERLQNVVMDLEVLPRRIREHRRHIVVTDDERRIVPPSVVPDNDILRPPDLRHHRLRRHTVPDKQVVLDKDALDPAVLDEERLTVVVMQVVVSEDQVLPAPHRLEPVVV